MQINVTYDQSSLPTGFVSAINYVVSYYDSLFTNNVTINLDVGYGEIDGQPMGAGALGESEAANYIAESYSSVRNALIAENAPGSSTLSASSPLSGTLYVSQAEAQALGLTSAVSTNYVGFSSIYPFSYAPNVTPSSNAYYFIGVVEHEISEDMGRVSLLDGQPSYYAPIDLFRYLSSGVRDTSTGGNGSTAYFSINSGAANLGTWNNNPNNGDLADWYPSGPAPGGNDAFNDYTNSGVIGVVSADDITLLSALGWTTTTAPVVTANNQTVAYNQSIPITNIFSVSGSGITQYQVWFSSARLGYPADGTLTVNGTPVALDQWVSLSSLNGVVYTGGPTAGPELIALEAYNGAWSNDAEIFLNDQGITPPSVTANNQTVAYNQSIPITNIFSVSGSGITQYQVWFSSARLGYPADGTLTVNGTPVALDQWVSLSSLNGVVYTGGPTAGPELIALEAYNGAWSNDAEIFLNDQGITPPSVTANNQTIAYNQSIPITNIFSVSGSGITQYQVWFSSARLGYPADGTLTVNGTPVALDQWVSLSSLNGVVYTGGPTAGPELIALEAYNGAWSNDAEIFLNDQGITPPSVTANNQTVAYNQSIPITNIFSVSGSGITQYQVWFSSARLGYPADGTLTVNGTPVALDQWVSLSSLNGVVYTGGPTAGPELIALEAYNGAWSNDAEIFLNDAGRTGNQDLYGDGTLGATNAASPTMPSISEGFSGPSEPSTIGNGATFILAAPDSASVTFEGSTGTLQLDDPSTFTGQIFEFTGNGSLTGSDKIDLTDINYNAVQNSYSGGVLTVTDSANSASLNFAGSYTLANFEFASDGNGGTIVYDPPVPGAHSSSPGQATAANCTPAGLTAFGSSQPGNGVGAPWTVHDDSQGAPGAASNNTLALNALPNQHPHG